ncbi:hypothetical protein [Plantactinospora sp. WMMB782]|uniref:hypothetical protein n=1 Tax=Plantactinospora sp. WMMB782 TaxID=3404121 RepID=UPI003B931B08
MNRIARILAVTGGALTVALLTVDMEVGPVPLFCLPLGVGMLGGVLLIIDAALRERQAHGKKV